MVGATAFMETLELALELRRAGYGANGDERLGLRPLPVHRGPGRRRCKRSVLQWRFIDASPRGSTTHALREAQQRKDAVRAYELVYAALGRDAGSVTRARRARRRDLGVKGLALAEDGAVLASAEAELPARRRRGRAGPSRTPSCWWQAAQRVLARAATRRPAAARASGCRGQMHGLVALDAADRVLRPAILWNDQRTAAECDEIEARVGLERLIALTGNRALTGFTAPKLLWMRAPRARAVRARSRTSLLPKDYVRLRLCGEHATDVADASRHAAVRRRARARWSAEVLDALEVDPRVAAARAREPEVSGTRRRRAGRGRRRRPGARARSASASTAPAGRCRSCSGTSGVVFAALERSRPTRRRACTPSATRVPGRWHAMGVMLSAAGSLRWLRDAIAPGAATTRCSPRRRRWAPGAEGLTFLPYLAGERTPHADPDARGAFAGLDAAPRPRRARARGARGRRLRRCATRSTSSRAGRPRPSCGRVVRRRRAQRAVAADRRLGARAAAASASPSTRARRSARRCSAASPAACGATSTRRWRACVRARERSSPTRPGPDLRARTRPATGRCTPPLEGVPD